MLGYWMYQIAVAVATVGIFLFLYFAVIHGCHEKWEKEMEKLYGKPLKPSYVSLRRMIRVISYSPAKEELIFRGPIWLYVISGVPLFFLLIMVIMSGYYFGIRHQPNRVYFEKGSVLAPNFSIIFISVCGMIYGLAVLVSGSILAPIISHILWNLSMVIYNRIKYRDKK